VIHEDSPDKYSLVETVETVPRAKTMALDAKTHRLFLSTAARDSDWPLPSGSSRSIVA